MAAIRTTTIAALAVLVCASAVGAQTAAARSEAAVDGKLYKSVFSAGAGALQPGDLARVPEPLRSRLARYLERRAAFKSRYASAPDTLEEMRASAKRRALERSIVALIDLPGIEKMAADFVSAAPIAGEWNGRHDGPLHEATYAEDMLKKNPSSPLAPWFYVFIAERQRVAFETYENEKDEEGMKAAARKYRTFLDRARSSAEDPIYAALADDMNQLPYLYLKSTNHPHDYDPDS
jgi:hypothetical protein